MRRARQTSGLVARGLLQDSSLSAAMVSGGQVRGLARKGVPRQVGKDYGR